MSQEVYVGVDLAKDFHQVMAVGSDHKVLAPTFRIGRGRGGVKEMIERLRFLVRQESDLVFTIEATSDYWWELAWELDDRGCVVYLAHPKKAHDLRKFYALHTKTDVTDAEALALMPLVDTGLRSLGEVVEKKRARKKLRTLLLPWVLMISDFSTGATTRCNWTGMHKTRWSILYVKYNLNG